LYDLEVMIGDGDGGENECMIAECERGTERERERERGAFMITAPVGHVTTPPAVINWLFAD